MPLDIPLGDFACIELGSFNGPLCIIMPGGAVICASASEIGDPWAIFQALLAQVNAMLAPLQPFFNILDVIKCVLDCIKAIPDSLGPPPNPGVILSCIENLAKAVAKLLEMFPPIPIFKLIKSILLAIIAGLVGIRSRLLAIIEHLNDIKNAAQTAVELGAGNKLEVVIDCANKNAEAWLANLNAGMAPLNRLIGLINALLGLVGLPCIPTLADVSPDALAPLDAAINALQVAADAIPTSIDFGIVPLPTDPC